MHCLDQIPERKKVVAESVVSQMKIFIVDNWSSSGAGGKNTLHWKWARQRHSKMGIHRAVVVMWQATTLLLLEHFVFSPFWQTLWQVPSSIISRHAKVVTIVSAAAEVDTQNLYRAQLIPSTFITYTMNISLHNLYQKSTSVCHNLYHFYRININLHNLYHKIGIRGS